jgi:sigma-B regulation protein RsbU (phosphoserine phosphatase)
MEQERHDSQLAFARDIQKRLLPQTVPKLPEVDLAVRYRPYEVLGGDFYDCFGQDGRLCVLLGDAEGHGPSAALLMATARAYIRATSHAGNASPASLLEQVNRLVCRDPGYSGFLPMMCLHLDCRAGLIRYCNAGHEGPLLVRSNPAERIPLSVTSPILGIQEGVRYSDREVAWNEGDLLVCFTDGLTDGTGDNEMPFGRKRLEELAARHSEEPTDRLADRIVASWAEHTHDQAKDDMTLILVRALAARRDGLR